MAISSPPLIPTSFIRLKELPPPPPIPITLIFADCFFKSSANSLSISLTSGDKSDDTKSPLFSLELENCLSSLL